MQTEICSEQAKTRMDRTKVMQRQAGLTQAKTMLGRFFVQTVITPVQLDMDGLCI